MNLCAQTLIYVGPPLYTPTHHPYTLHTDAHVHTHRHSLASLPLTIGLLGLAKTCDPAVLIEAEGLSVHRKAGRVDVSYNKTTRHQSRDKAGGLSWGGSVEGQGYPFPPCPQCGSESSRALNGPHKKLSHSILTLQPSGCCWSSIKHSDLSGRHVR